jgi:hypothetical protein
MSDVIVVGPRARAPHFGTARPRRDVAGAVFEAGVPTEKRCSRIATASRLIFTDLEQPEPSTLWKLRYRFWSRRNFQTLQNRRAAGIPVPGPFYNARRNDLCAVELGDGPYA